MTVMSLHSLDRIIGLARSAQTRHWRMPFRAACSPTRSASRPWRFTADERQRPPGGLRSIPWRTPRRGIMWRAPVHRALAMAAAWRALAGRGSRCRAGSGHRSAAGREVRFPNSAGATIGGRCMPRSAVGFVHRSSRRQHGRRLRPDRSHAGRRARRRDRHGLHRCVREEAAGHWLAPQPRADVAGLVARARAWGPLAGAAPTGFSSISSMAIRPAIIFPGSGSPARSPRSRISSTGRIFERFTDGLHCRGCPVAGHCDVEGSYEMLADRLFVDAAAPPSRARATDSSGRAVAARR